MKHRDLTASTAIFCLITAISSALPVAFPGAEGAGQYSTGGRGGSVYEVTNLNNSGPGSIVDAVSAGNRTIVFRVSGTIDLGGVILRPKSNTTIAGQTAPGDGICLKGRIYISGVSNVIIRYLRVRVDEGAANSSGDAIDIAGGSHIIIDHVSASYGRDETISCQDGSDCVTVQWCILSEALTFENHSYGSLVRGEYGEQKSYHHNLYAHNKGRNPRPGNYTSAALDPEGLYFDFRNNVVYNWSGTHPGYNADTVSISRYNFVGNVFIRGAGSSGTKAFKEDAKGAFAYWAGNAHGTSYSTVTVPVDQWSLITFNGFSTAEIAAYKSRSYEIPMDAVTTTPAAQALDEVLSYAGASFPSRDVIDTRIVNDVINGTGNFIAATSDQPEGAWPMLTALTAPTDSDHDGMPDAWEIAKGLSPDKAADRNGYNLHPDYTNLEVYLNSLIEADSDAPSAPTGLIASAGQAVITLNWNDNTEDDLAGYYVYRSATFGSGYVKLNTLPLAESIFEDVEAETGTPYYYRVTAIDTSANESDFSNEAEAILRMAGDIVCDNQVDINDLTAFLDYWLYTGCDAPLSIDLNSDCLVNLEDFVILSEHWLEGVPTWEVLTLRIQEFEPGFVTVIGTVDNNNAGYTASGFANSTNASGSYIEWRVNAPLAGMYNLQWRYANGSTANRTGQISVNGGLQASSVAFTSTGAWTTWEPSPVISVLLAEGNNQIRLVAETSEGLANIDWMEVTGLSPTPGE
jgi:pectate lyase